MLFQTYAKKIYEDNKESLTWTELNNWKLLKHLPSSITTALVHLDQERKNIHSTKQVKPQLEIQ